MNEFGLSEVATIVLESLCVDRLLDSMDTMFCNHSRLSNYCLGLAAMALQMGNEEAYDTAIFISEWATTRVDLVSK